MKVREDSVTLPDQQRPFHRCHTRREQADSAHNLGTMTIDLWPSMTGDGNLNRARLRSLELAIKLASPVGKLEEVLTLGKTQDIDYNLDQNRVRHFTQC